MFFYTSHAKALKILPCKKISGDDKLSRRKKVTQREVSDGLRRLAFGEITDAVSLLYESDENVISRLPDLDLFNVSEIKRPKGGGMEIKFFDRLKAIDKLRELALLQENEGKNALYEALEKSAAGAEGVYEEGYDG